MLIENIQPLDEQQLRVGCWIVAVRASSIPPHFMLLINGSSYSLHKYGVQCNEPLEPFMELIRRKFQPTLFFEWHVDAIDQVREYIVQTLQQYDRLKAGCISCLTPLRNLAIHLYGNEMQSVNFFFDLFPLLKKHEKIGRIMHTNMSSYVKEGVFDFPVYTREAVDAAIATRSSA
jgi:hypothetical protein